MEEDILQKIIQEKEALLRQQKRQVPLAQIQQQAIQSPLPRNFVQAIRSRVTEKTPAIIAEIKRASPSKGRIRDDFDPGQIAQRYEQEGAAALSVLTDEPFFEGKPEHLQAAKAATKLPVLQKDFIVDPYQIYESRLMGADAIILIVAALRDVELKSFAKLANSLHLAVLVEVHNKNELMRALPLPVTLIGINNRNLKTFAVSLNTSTRLAAFIPPEKIVISESGIKTQKDLKKLQGKGIYGYLVGESLMKVEDPGEALATLLGTKS